jgi:type I restriction enzyme M protein
MRKDVGINGDAQHISQFAWMLFLKIFDDQESELDVLRDNYKSPLASRLRWRNWAADAEGMEELLRWCDTLEAQLHQTRTLGAHLLDSTLHHILAS